MTDTVPVTQALKPCPFCGDPMEDRDYGAMHAHVTTCILSSYAFNITAWNTRAAELSRASTPAVGRTRVKCDNPGCDWTDGRAILALHPPVMGEVEREALRQEIINTPETADFMAGVPLEAAHQRERWGVDHDAGKSPFDWFWLIGYLAQKAASSAASGDAEKAMHHTISTAAALANWHAALSGVDTAMRPGINPATLSTEQVR